MYQGKHAAPVTGIRRKVLLGGAFVLVVGLGSVLTVVANAAEKEIYDPAQLLTACQGDTDLYGKAERYRFETWTYDGFTGSLQRVSGVDSVYGEGNVTR